MIEGSISTGQKQAALPHETEHVGGGGALALLAVLAVLALLGVYCAARAAEGAFQLFGACLAGFAILLQFRVIALLLPAQDGDH